MESNKDKVKLKFQEVSHEEIYEKEDFELLKTVFFSGADFQYISYYVKEKKYDNLNWRRFVQPHFKNEKTKLSQKDQSGTARTTPAPPKAAPPKPKKNKKAESGSSKDSSDAKGWLNRDETDNEVRLLILKRQSTTY